MRHVWEASPCLTRSRTCEGRAGLATGPGFSYGFPEIRDFRWRGRPVLRGLGKALCLIGCRHMAGWPRTMEISPMTTRILAIALVTLTVSTEAMARDKITAYFRPLYATFGQNSKTQIKIVSGPKEVTMGRGGVPGKQWVATSGKYRFKLTIEDGTGSSRDQLVAIV